MTGNIRANKNPILLLMLSRTRCGILRIPSLSFLIGTRSASGVDSATEVTHTGQKFSLNDPRAARFTQSRKLVDPHFPQDLIAEVPPIACKDRIASCDGGGGALGHPIVYINLASAVSFCRCSVSDYFYT
ncbi:unnamed protein product [Dicrocoelium dendriticum]|nr:unnamed protein product [Dicrocoelium dendriticum]